VTCESFTDKAIRLHNMESSYRGDLNMKLPVCLCTTSWRCTGVVEVKRHAFSS